MSEPDDGDDLDALTVLGEYLINSILLEDPLESVKSIIAAGAPLWYQNESEGISCLHAAVYIRNPDLVKLLLQDGAVWNATDYWRNTAADIALSFNNSEIYTIIRDAGIRAELVLALLSRTPVNSPTSMILQSPDDTSAAVSTDAFLSSPLSFTVDGKGQEICMLNVEGEEIGVMMGWERDIMQATVANLCLDREPKRILNVGFGLGIIDTIFQSLSPALHVIIEAHPDVLNHMKKLGWYDKPGVKILEGKWQDFINDEQLGALVAEGGFDVVYTDPFAEDFAMLQRFFTHLRTLLGLRGRFSFFNGLGATNAVTYDVMCRVAEINLADAGFNEVKWIDVDLSQRARDHFGDTRKYFTLPIYRLPIVYST